MSERKKTPSTDFDAWMTGDSAETPPTPDLVKNTRKKESKKSAKDEIEKVKASFHIDEKTAVRLDDMRYNIRRLTGLKGNSVTKSLIIDLLVEKAAADLEANALSSDLAKEIIKESKKK